MDNINFNYDDENFFEEGFDLDEMSKINPLSVEISRVLGKIDNNGTRENSKVSFGAIQQAWLEIGGKKASEETRSIYIREDVMVITLKSPIWAQELNLFSSQYRDMFNEKLKINSIKEVKFRVR